jgi:hypothetical protein
MYVFAEPVTEEQADEIQNAGEAAQKEFARTVVGIGKDDPETQAAWQNIQDDVDEQVGEDQSSAPALESQEGEAATHQVEPPTTIEGSIEDTAQETATGTEDASKTTSSPEGPLMGWTLTVRSLVNAGYVERPEKLDNRDEWKIEYHMKEIPEATRWKLYNALKERRRQLIGQDDEEADKGLKHYRDLIQRFSDRGRKWRKEQDKLNDTKGVQLYRPLGPGSGSGAVGPYNEVKKENETLIGVTTVKESHSEDMQASESLSQEKKEEVLESVPASPS